MQLKQFMDVAKDVHPEELGPFAHLASLYWDARIAGQRGLLQADVSVEQIEFLIELFEYDPTSGVYVHAGIDAVYQEHVAGEGRVMVTNDQFNDFWASYPNKVAKHAAAKSWARLVKSPVLAAKVIAALRKQITHHGWTDPERKQFCPHASTWLNQRRWEDELTGVPARTERRRAASPENYTSALAGVV